MVSAGHHDAGGARIEQSRKKTSNTTIAWPQCAHTKVGAGVVDASSADAAHAGGGTCNSSRASARLSRRVLLASRP